MVLDVSTAPRPDTAPVRAPSAASRNPALHATTAESLVVVVAPRNGRFHPAHTNGGVQAGDVLGHLTVGQGRRVDVPSPADLRVEGLLIRPGQLITAGQALLWGRLSERDAGLTGQAPVLGRGVGLPGAAGTVKVRQ